MIPAELAGRIDKLPAWARALIYNLEDARQTADAKAKAHQKGAGDNIIRYGLEEEYRFDHARQIRFERKGGAGMIWAGLTLRLDDDDKLVIHGDNKIVLEPFATNAVTVVWH